MYNQFDAYRHPDNDHNLIVLSRDLDYIKWKVATLVAKELNLRILAKLPMNPDYAALADAGKMDELDPVFINDGVEQILKVIEK